MNWKSQVLTWVGSILLLFLTLNAYAGGTVSTCDEASFNTALTGGGTVTFTCSGTITLTSTKTITVNTVINGGGTAQGGNVTLTGNVQLFGLSTSGVTLTLQNLTLSSTDTGDGPATFVDDGNLTITNSKIINNVGANGGAIKMNGTGTLTITDSLFENNSASYLGGAISHDGPAVNISNSIFRVNSAPSGNGGAIVFWTVSQPITITNTTFENNCAGDCSNRDGGAIYVQGGTSTITITGSTFGNNRANGGGAIYLDGVSSTISGSTFDSNQAVVCGAIRTNAALTATNTIFSNNQSNGNGGGGCFDVGGTFTDTQFIANNSGADGGGIFMSGGTATLTNVIFADNTAYLGLGGAFYTSSEDSAIAITNAVFDNNQAGCSGGAIRKQGTITIDIVQTSFTNNTSSGGCAGGAISQTDGTMNLANVTVSGNRGDNGGGIEVWGGTMTVLNSTLANNTTTGNGGGIFLDSGAINLKNTIVAGNTASTGPDIYGTVTSQGNNLIGDIADSMGITNGTNGDIVNPTPGLGALTVAANGTQYHPLLADSPAINGGNNTGCPATDQLGTTRPQEGNCDIGAYESVVYAFSTARDPASIGTGTINAATTTANGNYIAGTAITLTTTGLSVGETVTWSPANCTASFTMPANDLTCTATFDLTSTEENTTVGSTYVPPPPPPETKVTVAFGGTGQGKVTSNPTGIDCQSPYACNYTFKTNTAIQLNPQAVGNSRFQNWGNSCNNGTISASGGTVYCTVYFVDTTPPPIEPTPVDVPVDNQPPTNAPVDNPTPGDVPVDNQPSTDTPVDNPTPVDVPVDNQPSTDTPVDNPTPDDVPTDNQIPPPVADNTPPEEPPTVEEPVDVIPEPETVIPPAEVLPPTVSDETCPPKDSLSYYCNADGQTIGDLNIVENPEAGVGFLSNAVIVGTVQLNPQTWIANLHVTKTGIVLGGTVTGLNYNAGYMGDFTFKGEFIKGGTLGGKILNLSKIFSWFEDVTLSANAHLIGGALKGKIKGDPKKPALLENLRILAGSVVSGVIIGNGVKIDKDVKIEESSQADTPVDDAKLPALDEQFSAGIGVNDSSYQTKNIAQILSDNVSIRGKTHVQQKHVGQKVKIFVTVAYRFSEDSAEEFLFTINQLNGLMPWNGKKSSLGKNPFREEILQTTHSVKIYDGILLATGVVNIQFGYLLEDGTVVQTPESIELLTRE